ncbi:MAG TPA: glycosyl hydrolase [Polyangiaceae bacterium]|nr:glycosyl hydrolase [Polyangiaceae bacterium]
MHRFVSSTLALGAAFGLVLSACSGDSPEDANDNTPGGSGMAGTPGVAGSPSNGGSPSSAGASQAGTSASASGSSGTNHAGNGGNAQAGSAGQGGSAGQAGSTGQGGSTNAGASNGGSATAGAGGGSNVPGCVAPVNPNATKQAKNLLCYLYSQYGNHVISGQQETSWDNPAGDISWYTTNGMKAPAILGGDYLYPNGTTDRAIAYWKAGGIPMIRYHMGAPGTPDTYENSKGSANLDNTLKAGTTENDSFKSKLDYAAAELKKLQDQNVPVLWAPFHEVQQNGWFWWAKGSGAQFVGLWKYMFDYFTKTKGLNNLVWLMPFSGTPSAAYSPGKEYFDLCGPDTYAEDQPFTALFNTSKGIIGATTPIPLHETGRIPTPSAMFPNAPWVLFNVWATYQFDGTHNTTANIKSVYDDAHTVTRDEVPNLN